MNFENSKQKTHRESGGGVLLPVDVIDPVRAVVVLRDDDAPEEELARDVLVVGLALLVGLLELVEHGVRPDDLVADLAAHQELVLMLPDGRNVAGPQLQLVRREFLRGLKKIKI